MLFAIKKRRQAINIESSKQQYKILKRDREGERERRESKRGNDFVKTLIETLLGHFTQNSIQLLTAITNTLSHLSVREGRGRRGNVRAKCHYSIFSFGHFQSSNLTQIHFSLHSLRVDKKIKYQTSTQVHGWYLAISGLTSYSQKHFFFKTL